jgi:tetratricopeptide (TPR) repeat protein
MDRNRLEQDALAALNKGSLEGALASYQQILRIDPKDRRIRQKCGELCLRLGKPAEAERHMREVADSYLKEGNHRATLAVLRQLLAIVGDDAQVHLDIGDCSAASGVPGEAREHWDLAMRLWIGQGRPADALGAARRIADASPNDLVLRVKVAELLEAAGEVDAAARTYLEIAEEHRRRGRGDETGRIAELALRLRPDDVALLRAAASARLAGGDARGALAHLQVAFQKGPNDADTLDLLARAFEAAGQPEKARRVLSEVARVSGDARDYAREVEALRRAVALGADPAIEGRLDAAQARLMRARRRLTDLSFAAPSDEAQLRAVVRAEVHARYGFFDRALAGLDEALAVAPGCVSLRAALAEARHAAGRADEALSLARELADVAGAEADAVRERIAVWSGDALSVGSAAPAAPAVPVHPVAATPAAPVAPPPVAPTVAPVVTTPVPETAESRGDRLAEEGDLRGAVVAYREALAEDPLNDEVLRKIAALRDRGAAPARPAPAPVAPTFSIEDGGTFAEIVPDELDEVDDSMLDAVEGDPLETARDLIAVGAHADALALLEGVDGLGASVLRAEARRGAGEPARALEALKEAAADASDSDPAYPDALFELATLYTLTQKHRVALRTFEELRDLAPGHRPAEVEARIRGLQRLIK